MRFACWLLLVCLLQLAPMSAWPQKVRHSTGTSASHHGHRPAKVLAPGARNKQGRLARSERAKRDFERSTGHPGGWKGHVVDHITPLACGGSDSPSNMQWQTTAEAKAKDKVERRGCRH
jgi:hypothetical protein